MFPAFNHLLKTIKRSCLPSKVYLVLTWSEPLEDIILYR